MQKKGLINFFIAITGFYFAGIASAADNGAAGDIGIDLTIQDVFAIINGLTCWFARIASLLMVIFVIVAGLRFMAARGDSTAFAAAKKNFNHVLIGLVVIMGVYVIIATVANAVGVIDFSFIPLVC